MDIKLKYKIKYKFLFLLQHILGYQKTEKLIFSFYDSLENNISNQQSTNHNNIKSLINTCPKYDYKMITLIKGGASNWECVKKWDFDYLKSNYGSKKVTLINNKGLVDENIQSKKETILLSEFIDQLKSGSLKYLKLSELINTNKNLQNDINIEWLNNMTLPFSTGKTFYSFIGGKGTTTPIHNEFPVNIYIQVYGKKRWVLYPPDNHMFLNAITERRTYFHSNAHPDNIENPQTPLLKYASKVDIILEPGDILIVPPFTWHYVENLTDNIAMAYKYANIHAAFKSSVLFSILSFLSTKPSIFYSFIMSRIKKNDYVLNEN